MIFPRKFAEPESLPFATKNRSATIMKTIPLTILLSSVCLWTLFNPISNLCAADDPLAWVQAAVPAPDAEGWITLFDGNRLYACEPDSVRNRTNRIGVSNGELWLDNASLVFDVSARNVALRAFVKKVSGQNVMLKCRQNQGRSYGFWFNGGGEFGMGMYQPRWTDIAGARSARNFPDYFQMELNAKDSLITLKANETTLKAFENHAIDGAGAVAIGTYLGKSHFKKIQVKILDGPPPPLSWASTEGKTIQAEFRRLDGESVIVCKDGKEMAIPLAKLSLASRNQARELAAKLPTLAPPPVAASAASTPDAASGATGIPDHPSIPKPGAWKTANASGLPKPGTDRIFLVNRGWMKGRLTEVDASAVTMQAGGETFRLPRTQVSLIGTSDAYDPAKRKGGQEVRLRVVMEGPAEYATLHFNHGALIREVIKKSTWVDGADRDDKASISPTSISFEKGSDQSITHLETEIVLLLPKAGNLTCEVDNNRANACSGPLTLQFIELESGRLIAELTPPKGGNHGTWYGFEIDRDKLLRPSKAQKLSPMPAKFERSEVPTSGLISTQMSRPRSGAARLIFLDEPARLILLDSVNQSEIILADPQRTRIPRDRVVWIELLDWQMDMQEPAGKAASQTPPIRWISYGISTENRITLPGKTAFSSLIVPPHCIYGMDRGDLFGVRDERILECQRGAMDQSPFHMEMVATLALPPASEVEFQINNAFTNVWSGHWEAVLVQALSNRRIMDFKSGNWELNTSRKIQRSKLMEP